MASGERDIDTGRMPAMDVGSVDVGRVDIGPVRPSIRVEVALGSDAAQQR